MNINILQEEDITIVEFAGRMDATNATEFEDSLEGCFNSGQKKLIIDFSSLEYISSAGLRSILIIEKKKNTHNAQIIFCSLQSMVAEIFKISAFTTILKVVNTMDEAKKSFS